MPLINFEIYLELKLSAKCFAVAITVANQERNFIVTDNVKLLKKLESTKNKSFSDILQLYIRTN